MIIFLRIGLIWLFFAGMAAAQSCPVEILDVRAAPETIANSRPDPASWEHVTLPNKWNQDHPAAKGSIWYRIDWRIDCQQPKNLALLLPSIVMAGEVFINDHFLWADKNLTEPLSRSWNMPRYWNLPDAWLNRDGNNTLWVRVIGGQNQVLGLGPVYIGDAQSIYDTYMDVWWNNRTLFIINLIVSVVIGVFLFLIWAMRPDQQAYGWYALASLFWVIFIWNVLATTPWPFSNTVTVARVNTIAFMLNVTCFCVFTWRFASIRLKWIERLLWMVVGTLTCAAIFVPDKHVEVVQLTGICLAAVIFFANCIVMPIQALRSGSPEKILLGLCLLVMLVASFHDFISILGVKTNIPALIPYANIALILSLAGILGLKHARHLRRIERFNKELEEGIAQARRDLADTMQKEFTLKLASSKLQERLAIGNDLHDGLGGVLVHMIATVEQNNTPLNKGKVLTMLKLIRDDLRQTIDANAGPNMQVPETPAEWIVVLRHRFATLFDELGINSTWTFPDHWSPAPSTLQCLAMTRLIEEALTNVIKHSHANNVSVSLKQNEHGHLTLCIADDGVGFNVMAVQKAGISIGTRSMAMRISRIGGRLTFQSRPGCTQVQVDLSVVGN